MSTHPESSSNEILSLIEHHLDPQTFRDHHWTGTFWDYLDLCAKDPKILRNAYQRLYDAVLAKGFERYKLFKKECVRYHFFSDPFEGGSDGIFGLDFALMQLVDVLRSAAEGYGTDKRILLLHGPVGSSKSTIARLLKKGAEEYSKTDDGAIYSFSWLLSPDCDVTPAEGNGHEAMKTHAFPSPMHEDPLMLVPKAARQAMLDKLNASWSPEHRGGKLRVYGEPDPFSRKILEDLMTFYEGDWKKVMAMSRSAESSSAKRTASASAPSNPRTRRTRTPPSSPATSTTARSPSTAAIPTPAPSTSTASSTSRTAASASSSRSSSSTSRSFTISSAPPRNTRSSPRSSPRPTSTR
jgi:predicted Ser/Thr protein kinase